MQLAHAHTLAQARTYVATLSDHAADENASSAYERVLIELDRLHDDLSPDIDLDTYLGNVAGDRGVWFELAIVAVANLVRHGVDPLSVELICWMLLEAYSADTGEISRGSG